MNEVVLLIPDPVTIARARALGRILRRALAHRWNRFTEKLGDLCFNVFAVALVAWTIHSLLATFVPMLRELLFLY